MAKYTKPQEYAIFGDYGNLLVSAAAGSGKTFTLSSRIVELIKADKADIDEMLVVTFTKASAADMKRKIAKRLSDSAKDERQNNPKLASKLAKSAIKAQSAEISTIHSFLYGLIRRNLSELGLPQDSRLVSNTAILDKLKEDAMNKVITELFDSGDEDFLKLADILATVRDTSSLDSSLATIAESLSNNGLDADNVRRYADNIENSFSDADSLFDSVYGADFLKNFKDSLVHFNMVFTELEKSILLDEELAAKRGEEVERLIEWTESAIGIVDTHSYSAIKTLFTLAEFPRLSNLKRGYSTPVSVSFAYHRNLLKDQVRKQFVPFFTDFPEHELILSRDMSAKMLRILASVLEKYGKEFEKKKRDLSIIDFKDIEFLAKELLIDGEGNPTPTAIEAGKKYKYIFIDEYQDTNDTQDAIFRAIGTSSHRFMVGDIKQAIYHFRGADPGVFSGYRTRWDEAYPEAEESFPLVEDEGRVLFMSNNFRSAEPVTSLTNLVSLYTLPYGGIPYSDGDELICSKEGGKDSVHPNAEVVLLEKKKKQSEKGLPETFDDNDDEEEEGENPELLYIAHRIKNMIGRYLGDRLIKPEDIAVLMRSKTLSNDLSDILMRNGIRSVLDTARPLDRNPAVQLLICILNFVDNPLREVYAAGALRSPVFGFSSGDLMEIRNAAGKMPLYTGILKTAKLEEDSPLKERSAACIRWLEKQKTVSRGMLPSKYLEYITDEIDLFSIEEIRESGNERDGVNRLCAIAADYEASVTKTYSRADISAFLEYAEEVLSEKEKTDSAPSASEGAVSIMTIHASKGLEYPVVFVSNCGAKLNAKQEKQEAVPFDKKLGIGMMLPDESGLAKCDTVFRKAISNSAYLSSFHEEMRILYVALSRACTKLIVTAKVANLEDFCSNSTCAADFHDEYTVMNAGKYIDWIWQSIPENTEGLRIETAKYTEEELSKLLDGKDEAAVEIKGEEAEKSCDMTDYRARMNYSYPYTYLASLPSMLTVTRLSPNILDPDEEPEEYRGKIETALDKKPSESAEIKFRKPGFMIGEKMTSPTERGNATHAFFQFVDYEKLQQNGSVSELERLQKDKYISEGYASIVNRSQIERFSSTPLFDKLMRTSFIEREFRFRVFMDAEKLTGNEELKKDFSDNGVKVTVEGVVDLLFRDPDTGELTIVDYKTDSVNEYEWSHRDETYEAFRNRHRTQLSYYRDVCEEVFEEKIPHVYIYSTALAELIEI